MHGRQNRHSVRFGSVLAGLFPVQTKDDTFGSTSDPNHDEPQAATDGLLHAQRVMSNIAVIESFADAATADVFRGRPTRAAYRIPRDVWPAAQRKLKALDVAGRLQDLA